MKRLVLRRPTRRLPSRRRAGVVALEEILTLAVMIPLAFAILFMAWRMSAVMFQVIRAFVLSPVL